MFVHPPSVFKLVLLIIWFSSFPFSFLPSIPQSRSWLLWPNLSLLTLRLALSLTLQPPLLILACSFLLDRLSLLPRLSPLFPLCTMKTCWFRLFQRPLCHPHLRCWRRWDQHPHSISSLLLCSRVLGQKHPTHTLHFYPHNPPTPYTHTLSHHRTPTLLQMAALRLW